MLNSSREKGGRYLQRAGHSSLRILAGIAPTSTLSLSSAMNTVPSSVSAALNIALAASRRRPSSVLSNHGSTRALIARSHWLRAAELRQMDQFAPAPFASPRCAARTSGPSRSLTVATTSGDCCSSWSRAPGGAMLASPAIPILARAAGTLRSIIRSPLTRFRPFAASCWACTSCWACACACRCWSVFRSSPRTCFAAWRTAGTCAWRRMSSRATFWAPFWSASRPGGARAAWRSVTRSSLGFLTSLPRTARSPLRWSRKNRANAAFAETNPAFISGRTLASKSRPLSSAPRMRAACMKRRKARLQVGESPRTVSNGEEALASPSPFFFDPPGASARLRQ
mmetsp:Transcript_26594/g.64324  ORF Transcript_26594/g.64324 Transcript_26594/m.64324 type:complete len:340 (+) Transcript_26594:1706-2725(+)